MKLLIVGQEDRGMTGQIENTYFTGSIKQTDVACC